MELTYDWHCFKSVFRMAPPESTLDAISVVTDGERILSVCASGDDFSDWVGCNFSDLAEAYPARKTLRIEKDQVQEILVESLKLPHMEAQVRDLRGAFAAKTGGKASRGHFLLEAIASRWTRFLPASYGLFIRLGERDEEIFCVVRNGKIESFHEPDLASMGPDRSRVASDVVKYLSEKYLLPVQGLFCPREEWFVWSQATDPWAALTASVRAKRSVIAPFRWNLAGIFMFQRMCSGGARAFRRRKILP